MKFSITGYEISKSYAIELENKLKVFQENTNTRKTLFLTMVTTYGVKNAKKYTGLVEKEIKMERLQSFPYINFPKQLKL